MRPVFDQVSEAREKDPSEIPLCGSLREFHGTSGLLDIDLGLKEWNELDSKEIVRKYRQFVYETGAVDARPVKCSGAALSRQAGQDLTGQGKGKTIDQKVVEKARKKGYKISRVERFRYRCRYFTRLNRPKVYGSAVQLNGRRFNRINV